MADVSILWFRQDLRLHDQAALVAAAVEGAVVPVYIFDDVTPGDWAIGRAQRWWLHHSLSALAKSLEQKGLRLVLRRGRPLQVLSRLGDELDTRRIHAVRHYEPWWQGSRSGSSASSIFAFMTAISSPRRARS